MATPQPETWLVQAYEEHKTAADLRLWLNRQLWCAMGDQQSEANIVFLIDRGANINRVLQSGHSLLSDVILYMQPRYARLLWKRGACFNNLDYSATGGPLYGAANYMNFLRYAELTPPLVKWARGSGYMPAQATDRLLRMGLSIDEFAPSNQKYFLNSEKGRWWQLRTGPHPR